MGFSINPIYTKVSIQYQEAHQKEEASLGPVNCFAVYLGKKWEQQQCGKQKILK